MKEVKNRIAFVLLLLFCSFISLCSQTIVKGVIKDANTQQPLQSVSVFFKGGKGIASRADGSYKLTTGNTKLTLIQFSYVGYKTVTKTIATNKEQVVNVNLELSEGKNVVVKTNKRGKYSNKNNPAVELIRKVIDNKSKNKISSYDYVSYEQYEKMEVSLSNTPEKLINNKLFKNFESYLKTGIQLRLKVKLCCPFILKKKYRRSITVIIPKKIKHIF